MLVARNRLEPWGVRPVLCSKEQRGEPEAAAAASGDLPSAPMSATGLDTWDRLLLSLLNLGRQAGRHSDTAAVSLVEWSMGLGGSMVLCAVLLGPEHTGLVPSS